MGFGRAERGGTCSRHFFQLAAVPDHDLDGIRTDSERHAHRDVLHFVQQARQGGRLVHAGLVRVDHRRRVLPPRVSPVRGRRARVEALPRQAVHLVWPRRLTPSPSCKSIIAIEKPTL